MSRIALAHDYFLQTGGAERVAAGWLSHFVNSDMHTMAFDPCATFTSIEEKRVKSLLHGNLWTQHLHKLLPLLPIMASKVRVVDADVALVSTSGWAHQFRYDMPTVAYVHSPARWLYAANDYKMGLSAVPKAGLFASSPYLVRKDRPAMRLMNRIVSNSKVTQERVWKAYRIDSDIISPPVHPISAVPQQPRSLMSTNFLLIVARNRGYKRLHDAATVARKVGKDLVIIGTGTEQLHDPRSGIYGLGRVTDGELRWLYRSADALLATGQEDFGLTVLEANSEGTPVVAIPFGGYLETVNPGVNGVLTASADIATFRPAILEALNLSPESCRSWAAKFSLDSHMQNISRVIADV